MHWGVEFPYALIALRAGYITDLPRVQFQKCCPPVMKAIFN
jgi:hypothetical protein